MTSEMKEYVEAQRQSIMEAVTLATEPYRKMLEEAQSKADAENDARMAEHREAVAKSLALSERNAVALERIAVALEAVVHGSPGFKP